MISLSNKILRVDADQVHLFKKRNYCFNCSQTPEKKESFVNIFHVKRFPI